MNKMDGKIFIISSFLTCVLLVCIGMNYKTRKNLSPFPLTKQHEEREEKKNGEAKKKNTVTLVKPNLSIVATVSIKAFLLFTTSAMVHSQTTKVANKTKGHFTRNIIHIYIFHSTIELTEKMCMQKGPSILTKRIVSSSHFLLPICQIKYSVYSAPAPLECCISRNWIEPHVEPCLLAQKNHFVGTFSTY